MTQPLRVLFVISDFVGGGAERELRNLIAALPRDRVAPSLAVWRDVFDYPPPDDTPVHVLGKRRVWDAPGTAFRTARLIDSIRPDVVFSQLPYVSLLTGLGVRWSRWRPPWICRLAGNPFVDIDFPLREANRRVLGRADLLAGCSLGVTEAISDHLRVPPSRTRLLPNIVDVSGIRSLAREPAAVPFADEAFTFLTAGRLAPQKNHSLLLQAFSRFRGREANLWVLGKGPLEKKLKMLADRLGIARQVRWPSFVSNPYPLFHAADAFLLGSNHEGMPNVLIEALVCGVPVVATDCPYGPSELIDAENGRLVPVGDVAAMGEAMEWIVANASFRDRCRDLAGERTATAFDSDPIRAQYLDAIEEVAHRASTRPLHS